MERVDYFITTTVTHMVSIYVGNEIVIIKVPMGAKKQFAIPLKDFELLRETYEDYSWAIDPDKAVLRYVVPIAYESFIRYKAGCCNQLPLKVPGDLVTIYEKSDAHWVIEQSNGHMSHYLYDVNNEPIIRDYLISIYLEPEQSKVERTIKALQEHLQTVYLFTAEPPWFVENKMVTVEFRFIPTKEQFAELHRIETTLGGYENAEDAILKIIGISL